MSSAMPAPSLSRGQETQKDERDSPSNRLLRAVEIIAANGPMTHSDLKTALGISKTATWRLVKTLRDVDWVDLRNGGTYVELSAHLQQVFAGATYADPEFRPIMDAMADAAEAHPVSLELYASAPSGQIVHLNSTRRIKLDTQADQQVDDLTLLALRGTMTEQQLETNITYLLSGDASPEDVNSEFRRTQERLQGFDGQARSLDRSTLSVSILGKSGTPATLVIGTKPGPEAGMSVDGAFDLVAARAKGHVKWFGTLPNRRSAR